MGEMMLDPGYRMPDEILELLCPPVTMWLIKVNNRLFV